MSDEAPSVYELPAELRGLESEINDCLAFGRRLSSEIAGGKKSRDGLTRAEEACLGLTAVVHAFADKIDEGMQHYKMLELECVGLRKRLADAEQQAEQHADALARLCRAKLTCDALRQQVLGFGSLGEHDKAAVLMGAVDHFERALGTTKQSLQELVRLAMEKPT